VANSQPASQHALDPATSSHLKMNFDGFTALLTVTLQIDGKTQWSGTAGDQKASQGLQVAPGKHELRVTVKGHDGSKTSNTVSGDFAAKKRTTLSLKLRPQVVGGTAVLDPSAQLTVSLKKDLFQF
jgi:hypothetical protein